MSASVCTFYEILLTFFSASAPTELPSAGTPFTRCWQPGRRRCHPWRDIRGTRLSGRCIWQNKGRGVCLPFLGHCRGHDQGLPLTSPRLFSRIHNRSDFWTLQARKQKTGKHAGFLDKSLGWAPPLTSCLNVLLSLSAFICALSMRPEGSVTVQLRVPFEDTLKQHSSHIHCIHMQHHNKHTFMESSPVAHIVLTQQVWPSVAPQPEYSSLCGRKAKIFSDVL